MKPIIPESLLAFAPVDSNEEEGGNPSMYADVKSASSLPNQGPASFAFNNTSANSSLDSTSTSTQIYPGDLKDDSGPLRSDGYQKLEFPDPALFISFYDKSIAEGAVTLHNWQVDFHEKAAAAKPTQQNPYKECLLTCNGSGKDAFIIAGWAAWFTACKIKSRVIITSSSGVQLTSQTENYLATFCQKVNDFHGCEIFKVRQRFIKCLLSGSEIRLFATDEAGRAEGYHPLEPYAEMTIIVNEAKTVSEEIHGALRRCTGYNYWFEISSAGEPFGSFHKAYTNWPNTRCITAYDCSHIPRSEIEAAKKDLGENSALFRSIYLAQFTSLGGETIITQELIEKLLKLDFDAAFQSWPLRIGIDLAAGGDEDVVCYVRGNKCIKELCFRETDTEITADRIDHDLRKMEVSQSHQYIFADDGGVGRSIIDKLIRRGWQINRVLNQSRAALNKVYGNRGAENWDRVKRIFEERFFDVSTLSERTREQLFTRHYKKSAVGGRIFLESKKEAKSEGRPSPDRADGFILTQTGLTIDDYIVGGSKKGKEKEDERPKQQFRTNGDLSDYYDNEVTFGPLNNKPSGIKKRKIYNSLQRALSYSK